MNPLLLIIIVPVAWFTAKEIILLISLKNERGMKLKRSKRNQSFKK